MRRRAAAYVFSRGHGVKVRQSVFDTEMHTRWLRLHPREHGTSPSRARERQRHGRRDSLTSPEIPPPTITQSALDGNPAWAALIIAELLAQGNLVSWAVRKIGRSLQQLVIMQIRARDLQRRRPPKLSSPGTNSFFLPTQPHLHLASPKP